MSEQYAGDPDNYPEDFTIPDDADPPTAAVTNVALEALGDRTEHLRTHSPRLKYTVMTASGTWTAPARVTRALIIGCGGGGGGGKGANGSNGVDDRWIAGAGGGGGALLSVLPVIIVPASVYNGDIGAGGAGATVAGNDGSNGGDTIFRLDATELAVFGGALGGSGARGGHVVGLWEHFTLGGSPRAGISRLRIGAAAQGVRYDTSDAMWAVSTIYIPIEAGSGGYGAAGSTNPASLDGRKNPSGNFAGGAPGTRGADLGAARGGGGGGGGGAGPFGAGGAGGNGGSAVVPAGVAGASAAANTGAGGGGGGSGGYAPAAATAGGNGGNGGSGLLIIVWTEDDA